MLIDNVGISKFGVSTLSYDWVVYYELPIPDSVCYKPVRQGFSILGYLHFLKLIIIIKANIFLSVLDQTFSVKSYLHVFVNVIGHTIGTSSENKAVSENSDSGHCAYTRLLTLIKIDVTCY